MADKLTPQQKMAVENRGGRLLVSAAAGSGKTKVLVDRLLSYLTDPVNPANLDEFLIITYTKAAASELRGKIAAKLSEKIAENPENRHLQKQMQRLFLTKISTVHGFCGDLLRQYAYRLDLSADFRVADENECREIRENVLDSLLDRTYENAWENEDFRAFVDTQGLGRTDKLVEEIILQVYDSARCHLDPEGWLENCLTAADAKDLTDASQTVWGAYLIAQLKEYLHSQIRVFKQCIAMAEQAEGLEKATLNLNHTLQQLERLSESVTWDEVVARKEIDYGRLDFPRKYDHPEISEPIKAARNRCKKHLEKKLDTFSDTSEQVLGDLNRSIAAVRGIVGMVRQFDRDYTAAKRSRRVMDFSDLEHKTLDLLLGSKRTGPTAAAAEISGQFREIMVDEYQDSNGVQDAIFSVLTEKKKNCFMVGDVKQSIYQFRLADPDIFLRKYHSFFPAEEARPGEGRKIMLSSNFRSGGEVIEAVNDVFRTCMTPKVGGLAYGEAEALHEGIPHDPLPTAAVELHALATDEDAYGEEAAYVAQRIREMLDNRELIRKDGVLKPVEAEDIAILLRSPGSVGEAFRKAMEIRGIRCASGGGNNLLKTREIATLRALLQTVYNPRQDIPLISILASPVFGFDADDLAALRSGRRYGSVYDALMEDISTKAIYFRKTLAELRAQSRLRTLTELLESCFRLTRMDSIFASMPGGEARMANLQTFYQLAAEYEASNHRDLGQFLDHLDALEEKGLIAPGSQNAGCVTIMSIHKSKGLEFPVVFLCGLSRKFNQEDTKKAVLCNKTLGLGLSIADTGRRIRYPSIAKRAISLKIEQDGLSEEMRVLYVAMTRARDRLIMTYAAKNLESRLQEMALLLDFDKGELLCAEVSRPGDWILLTAMQRIEAGALFALGGRPSQVRVKEPVWKIVVSEGTGAVDNGVQSSDPVETVQMYSEQMLYDALSFRYPYLSATQTPSKQTATGKKGRVKDEEAAEHTRGKRTFTHWRKPKFLCDRLEGADYGSAIHSALQYIRYAHCDSLEGIRAEIRRMEQEGFLSAQQAEAVDCESLWRFFETEIGQKLRKGCEHLREFKFSILDDAAAYEPGVTGEQVLLQGVVDCAILESDGITVVDFKTDRVTEQTISEATERYRPQVETYADALGRIFEKTVKERYLYFFRLNRFVKI